MQPDRRRSAKTARGAGDNGDAASEIGRWSGNRDGARRLERREYGAAYPAVQTCEAGLT